MFIFHVCWIFFFFENSDRLLCGWIWIFWKVDGIYFDLSWFSKISWIVGLWGFVIVIWWVYFYFELRLMEFVWVWIWNFCIARFDFIQIEFKFLNIKINLWLYWNKLKEINFNVSILRDLKWLWKLFSNYSFISVWFLHSKFNFLMQIKFNLLNFKNQINPFGVDWKLESIIKTVVIVIKEIHLILQFDIYNLSCWFL